ncbi:unnamed protein product [Owenia fusiformis]|uniref:Uncharacterized protein n=1 Tax=Owenia fusiformis TaxID=6347 RepID=A0A8J1UT85_OWEFU|nr:unnamed protein product [Owenia fusiformis]
MKQIFGGFDSFEKLLEDKGREIAKETEVDPGYNFQSNMKSYFDAQTERIKTMVDLSDDSPNVDMDALFEQINGQVDYWTTTLPSSSSEEAEESVLVDQLHSHLNMKQLIAFLKSKLRELIVQRNLMVKESKENKIRMCCYEQMIKSGAKNNAGQIQEINALKKKVKQLEDIDKSLIQKFQLLLDRVYNSEREQSSERENHKQMVNTLMSNFMCSKSEEDFSAMLRDIKEFSWSTFQLGEHDYKFSREAFSKLFMEVNVSCIPVFKNVHSKQELQKKNLFLQEDIRDEIKYDAYNLGFHKSKIQVMPSLSISEQIANIERSSNDFVKDDSSDKIKFININPLNEHRLVNYESLTNSSAVDAFDVRFYGVKYASKGNILKRKKKELKIKWDRIVNSIFSLGGVMYTQNGQNMGVKNLTYHSINKNIVPLCNLLFGENDFTDKAIDVTLYLDKEEKNSHKSNQHSLFIHDILYNILFSKYKHLI